VAREDNTLLYIALGAVAYFVLAKTKLVNAGVPPGPMATPPLSPTIVPSAPTATTAPIPPDFGITDTSGW
jgi:hypothetical protein